MFRKREGVKFEKGKGRPIIDWLFNLGLQGNEGNSTQRDFCVKGGGKRKDEGLKRGRIRASWEIKLAEETAAWRVLYTRTERPFKDGKKARAGGSEAENWV